MSTDPGINASALDELIGANAEALCRHFFPSGARIGTQWRIAWAPRIGASATRPGSIWIELEGDFAGCWRDEADKSCGTLISLIVRRHNLSFHNAVRAIEACLVRQRPDPESLKSKIDCK
jgi:hypothetical protein